MPENPPSVSQNLVSHWRDRRIRLRRNVGLKGHKKLLLRWDRINYVAGNPVNRTKQSSEPAVGAIYPSRGIT